MKRDCMLWEAPLYVMCTLIELAEFSNNNDDDFMIVHLLLIRVPPDCHHPARTPHRCHFNRCPPCKQTCEKSLQKCGHICPAKCHTAVLTKVQEKVSTDFLLSLSILLHLERWSTCSKMGKHTPHLCIEWSWIVYNWEPGIAIMRFNPFRTSKRCCCLLMYKLSFCSIFELLKHF